MGSRARGRGGCAWGGSATLKGRTQPIVLDEAVDFEWEEHNVDRLTFALQALAQRLAMRLANRGLMAQQVGSRIERADGTVQQFTLVLPEPSGSAARLRDAARWRLESWADTQADDAVQEIPLHRPGWCALAWMCSN